ncbi:2Fe-2S iron-sulfur cluster binding domain-containing protein [Bdellovibrio sp. 22V]|uniref:2Fe-2S iron-sulfur cluster binding domain-containing protein n=1 Tax=Bdellovibrio TaxID=958 RepID=UPI002543D027|nr:2Fe-2S iron-sulfur cluster binding domain-containing protein [Bdellovibrio sp. 22V]WII73096.1 2Fe-2S iron-sulfur cluster binding domain-containing protein [Bdellovibrio sp. 22V]
MKVKFILNGEEIEVEGESGRSILDIALIAGIHPPYSCMEGHCGTCTAKIEVGEVSEDKTPDGKVRTCQALPKSDYVVVDYDKGQSN